MNKIINGHRRAGILSEQISITKEDYLKLHSSYSDLLYNIATLIISASVREVEHVDAHILLQTYERFSSELKQMTRNITGG